MAFFALALPPRKNLPLHFPITSSTHHNARMRVTLFTTKSLTELLYGGSPPFGLGYHPQLYQPCLFCPILVRMCEEAQKRIRKLHDRSSQKLCADLRSRSMRTQTSTEQQLASNNSTCIWARSNTYFHGETVKVKFPVRVGGPNGSAPFWKESSAALSNHLQ